jgi:hypothetical protein
VQAKVIKESHAMRYIEAVQTYKGNDASLFLAGEITGCQDWQKELRTLLQDVPLTLLNPRRSHFAMDDPDAAQIQIEWEHIHLRKATAIAFWFPHETLCPIALYELGAWSMTRKPLFVGVHPAYQRRQDVLIQTALVRPDIHPVSTLVELAQEVVSWTRHSP